MSTGDGESWLGTADASSFFAEAVEVRSVDQRVRRPEETQQKRLEGCRCRLRIVRSPWYVCWDAVEVAVAYPHQGGVVIGDLRGVILREWGIVACESGCCGGAVVA